MSDKAKAEAIEEAARRQAATRAAAATGRHIHNDNGEQIVKGTQLVTYCTCGHAVASDDLPDE